MIDNGDAGHDGAGDEDVRPRGTPARHHPAGLHELPQVGI